MSGWIERDLKHLWHPYTQMKDCETDPPICIDRALGIRLYDAEGNFYYDTISSWWCNVHGHNHPAIKKAIRAQLSRLDHVLFAGFTHKNAIILAERLVSIAPEGLSRVFFSDNGSTAVETALKISYQFWRNTGAAGKRVFVSLDRGYHGDTIGAMAASGENLFNKTFKGLFFKSYKVPSPYCYRCPMGRGRGLCDIDCIKPLEALFRERSRDIAALVLEPLLMAAGGMIVYPKEYLARAASLARRHGIHLILDEVATGFGRTGRMFACAHAGALEPDFLCLAKGITGGCLPLGATLTTEKIYRAFYDDYAKKKTLYHGHTYTANPIAVSAALASLDIFEKEDVLERMKGLMPVFHEGLESLRDLPAAGDVRYIGMVGAVELVKDKGTKKPFGFKERVGRGIYREGLKRRLILRPLGDIVYLFLPLCVRKNELRYILDNTRRVLEAARFKI